MDRLDPSHSPVARKFFSEWRRLRGDAPTSPGGRPFGRGWETLLEEAGLRDAVARGEAERDVRALASDGWLELKSVPYRPHLLQRIILPTAAESRWQAAFGFVPPSVDEAARLAAHPWQPALAFVREVRIAVPLSDLLSLDAFLATQPAGRVVVPVKERSWEIFGDEKRLDELLDSVLFREGRLTLDHLRCRLVHEPLGWRRGAAPSGPILVLENLATWDSFFQRDARRPRFAAFVYGGGLRFTEGVAFLAEIFGELGGPRPILYFGDLDATGLRIPARASRNAAIRGLPAVEPHLPAYRALLDTAAKFPPTPSDDDPCTPDDCAWLGPLAEEAWRVLAGGGRLAQERVGQDAELI